VLIESGAVGDDPLIFVERHAGGIVFDPRQRNGQRARNVACHKRLRTANIHDDGRAAVQRGQRLLYRHARDIGLGLREVARPWRTGRFHDHRWQGLGRGGARGESQREQNK